MEPAPTTPPIIEEPVKAETQAPSSEAPAPQKQKKAASNNPVIAIAIAIALALILSGLSLVSFLRSDAHKKAQLSQETSTSSNSVDSEIDTTSPLRSTDLDNIQSSITQDLAGANDETDLSPNELTDAALGL